MNYSVIRSVIGKIMVTVGLMMLLPMLIAIIYNENIQNIMSFLIPIICLLAFGLLLCWRKPEKNKILAREGFVIVGLSWLLMSLVGCVPFVISGEIPNYATAFFEMASGFTTTGSSALTAEELDSLSHSMLFWRSFSHWIGGMGILVFILALIPESKEGSAMHILRAESPGPQVGKLVSRMQATSRILYIIYMVLTVLLFIILLCCPDSNGVMGNDKWFTSALLSFGTAGTGGFSPTSLGCGIYDPSVQYVLAIFMLIFGINFSMFYLLLMGNWRDVLKNEELRWYIIIVIISVGIITANIYNIYNNFEESFRHSLFQVASIISTTGYSTVDYCGTTAGSTAWPILSISIIVVLTITGACAGSTSGGMKISRVTILTKSSISRITGNLNPRKVKTIRMDGKPLSNDMVNQVFTYVTIYALVLVVCALLISIYNPNMPDMDFSTAVTASLTCVSNVGPGIGKYVGPAGSFSGFSSFSKVILALEMITGRLELIPMLLLFNPETWRKRV